MIVGRPTPTSGNVIVGMPAAQAIASAPVPTVTVTPPPPPRDRWELVHRAGSVAGIIALALDVATRLLFRARRVRLEVTATAPRR